MGYLVPPSCLVLPSEMLRSESCLAGSGSDSCVSVTVAVSADGGSGVAEGSVSSSSLLKPLKYCLQNALLAYCHLCGIAEAYHAAERVQLVGVAAILLGSLGPDYGPVHLRLRDAPVC